METCLQNSSPPWHGTSGLPPLLQQAASIAVGGSATGGISVFQTGREETDKLLLFPQPSVGQVARVDVSSKVEVVWADNSKTIILPQVSPVPACNIPVILS